MDLLPLLLVREAWAVGLVVLLAALRPVGRLGWTAATALIVAGAATVATGADGPTAFGSAVPWDWVALAGWIVLAGILVATAVARPLRWEPRTGPSAATALIAGSAIVHVGVAWHVGGTVGQVGADWLGGAIGPGDLEALSAGPLGWPLAWLFQAPPVIDARTGGAVLTLGAVGLVVLGAERLGRRWGHVGTARCVAAAVAWAPPLLLAHSLAPWALLATAALVWSWWALVEVWAGRHRAGRAAFVSGALLGVAVGISLWPVVLLPLWLRRYSARTAGWAVVGFGAAIVVAVGALVPTEVGFADIWRFGIMGPVEDSLVPVAALGVLVAASLLLLALGPPLSPTRLSAVTAAILLALVPWWPVDAALAGPVTAIPFVLLTVVAPDRPDERWPPDAVVPEDGRHEVGV